MVILKIIKNIPNLMKFGAVTGGFASFHLLVCTKNLSHEWL